jgi:serine/threonine protein phosphatase PrpC
VADGMGGHQAGDVASQMVVNRLAKVAPPKDAKSLLNDVESAILQANGALREEAISRGRGTVIGTTVVALMMYGGYFVCLWAGDSRLYRFRQGALHQLSHDHSQVQELVDAGLLSADEAERHPMANVITRAVGAYDELRLDKITDALAEDDVFLICTDGLSKLVSDDKIAAIMAQTALAQQPSALIATAIGHGGTDNVTAVVVGVSGGKDISYSTDACTHTGLQATDMSCGDPEVTVPSSR